MSNQQGFSLLELVFACLLCSLFLSCLLKEFMTLQGILLHLWQIE